MNSEKGQIITGARARFFLGNKKIGWATGVNGSEEYMWEGVDVLDNVETEEHAIIGYRCDLSCAFVGISTRSLRADGVMPKLGSNSEEHLKNILALGVLSAVLEDSGSSAKIRTYQTVRVARQDFQVVARGTMGLNVQLVAIRATDIAE